ncbi:MAG: hypothetical protein GY820_46505, partial [Gammaproteobacteria bacterium]|nr:hypothetical protein [Gammaproteobacteria bacterium]
LPQQQPFQQPQYYPATQPSSSQSDVTPVYQTAPLQTQPTPQGPQMMQAPAFGPTLFQHSTAYYTVPYYTVPQPQSLQGVAQPPQQQYVSDPQSQLQTPSAFQPVPMVQTYQAYVPTEVERLVYRDRAPSQSSREPSQTVPGYAGSETASQHGYPMQVTPVPYESPDVAGLSVQVAGLHPSSSIPRGEEDRKRDHSRSKDRSPTKHRSRRKDSRSQSSSDEDGAETRRQIKEAEKLILEASRKLEKRDRERDRRWSVSQRRVPQQATKDPQSSAQKAVLVPTSSVLVPSVSPEKQPQYLPQMDPSDSQSEKLTQQEIRFNRLIAQGFTPDQAHREIARELSEYESRHPPFAYGIPREGLVFGKHAPQSPVYTKKGPDQAATSGKWHHPAKGRGQPFLESTELYSPGAPMSTLSGSDQSRPQVEYHPEFPSYLGEPKIPVRIPQSQIPQSATGFGPMEVAPDRVRTARAGQWSHQGAERVYVESPRIDQGQKISLIQLMWTP